MRPRVTLIAFVVFGILLQGCKKDSSSLQCQEFKQALYENNVASVRDQITIAINNLSNNAHTKQNLDALVAALSNMCGITVQVVCFACIDTLPEQSEIQMTFTIGGNTVQKTIDISATTVSNTKMRFVNMHD